MLSAWVRRGTMLCLLVAGCLTVCAQEGETPAAQRQAADRRFLLRRGLGPAQPGAASPLPRLAAARAQQAAMARRSARLGAGIHADTSSRARAEAASLGSSTTTWQPSGPVQLSTPAYGLVTGRVSSVAVDPNDSSGKTVYLGATGGGVWKSTNAAGNAGSVSFRPLTDDLPVFANSFTSIPSLSIGALTVEPGNPQVVLAGTGDPNDALDSYYGVGILRSSDGGNTWKLIEQSSDSGNPYFFQGVGFAGFAWSSATPNLVVAAASQSAEGLLVNTGFETSAESGLYYSTDAGQSWYLATISDGTNQIIQSSNPATSPPGASATSVVWNPKRNLFVAAIRFHGYYSSPDGVNWTRLANQPGANLSTVQCPANPGGIGSTSCPIFRGALAVQPATGDTFALTTDLNNKDQGLYQDVCSTSGVAVSSCASNGISFGKQIPDGPLDAANGSIPQADYNLTLAAVASQQDTILFAGTEDIYRCSLANSCNWRNTTNDQTCAAAQVAPSTHAIDSTFGANGLLYFGNDGGLWRSTDTVGQTGSVCATSDASHFQNLNGGIGSLAEISHLAVSPQNGSLVLAGMGGFGVVGSESAAAQGGTGAWQQLLTGEGSFVAIDPTTPANWYADSGAGVSIFSCTNGGNCDAASFGSGPVIGEAQVENDAEYLVTNGFDAAPWILDPLNPGAILLGTCRMWLGPVNGDWSSANLLSTMLDGEQGSFCNGNAAVRSVGAGGSYNSPQGGEQMYAGMAGPLDGGGTVPGHVYGATVPQSGDTVSWSDLWRNPVTNISLSSQFNADGYAISSIAVDPHDPSGKAIYASIAGFPTGSGGILYSSADGGAHWANITNSLPYAPVNSVVVDPDNSSYVYVGGDFGVYYTSNIASCSITGLGFQNCWSQLGANLPNAPVTELKVYKAGNGTVLEAATYGRGIWTLGLTTSAVAAQAALAPGSFTFPAQGAGSQSASVGSFTLSNTGSVPLQIGSVAVSPASDYTETNNCGSSLVAGSQCSIQVRFTPSTTGDRPGSLTIQANTQAGKLTATLDGTGLTPGTLTLNPTSLSFPTTATGASSSPQSITLQNTGGATLQLGARSFTGADPAEYSLGSSSCGSTLAAGASCSVQVIFSPSQTGTRTAQLQIAANSKNSPFLINLTGNAVLPAFLTLTPTSLSFPTTAQGSVSPAQTISVANTGGTAAQLGTASVSGDYKLVTNTCGSTLPAGTGCTVGIEFAPTATGSRAGLFTLPSPSIPRGYVTASLGGNGVPAPQVAFSPGSLAFGPQQQATTSAAQTVTVTNSGGSTAQLGTPTASSDFAISGSTCPASLPVQTSCTVSVTFTPAAQGPRSGTLTLPVNTTSVTAALSGTGVAPGLLNFSPTSLSFANTAETTVSPAQTVTVTNNGGSPARITGSTVSGPFAIAGDTCPIAPQTLAVNAGCTLQVTFTPPGTASYTGAVALSGNVSNSPAQLPLSGNGALPPNATLYPASLTFPGTAQGSASVAQTITVTSTGGIAVTLQQPSISTTNFVIAGNNCPIAPNTLPVGSSCQISILFHPGSTGPLTGAFTQPGNLTGSPLTVSLAGTGLQPGAISLSPAALQFGSAVVGTKTAAQPVTVTNTGGAPITLAAPAISGDYALVSNGCAGATLAAGGSCTLSVQFSPTDKGDRRGHLTVSDSGGAGSGFTALDGTGLLPGSLALAPASLAFGNVPTGSSATGGPITVTNSGDVPVRLSSLSVSGDFAVSGGSCSLAASIAVNGSCTVTVTFTPGTAGTRTGILTLVNDGTPAKATAALSGVGVAPGNLAVSPASLQFGPVVIGSTSPVQTVTATNSGGAAVSLGQAYVTGSGYSIQNNLCGSSLASGASCTLQVAFKPIVAGSSNGSLTLPGSYSGSPQTVALSGSGVAPGALSLAPSPVNFGQVVVQSSASQAIALQNTGGAPVTLGAAAASSGFTVASSCGSTLAPGAICTLQVTFTPPAAGVLAGLLTVQSSAGSATDALAGTGVLPGNIGASAPLLSYAATEVGSTAAAQSVTFRNSGGVGVPLAATRVSSSDYSITANSCGANLDPGGSCAVSVAFTPTAAGDRGAVLTLAGTAANAPNAQVALDGTGLAPPHLAFSPASLNFGQQSDNTTSASQTLTLTNSGGVSTGIGTPVLTGEFAITSNSCGSTLAAGGSCQIAVQFVPNGSGSQTGSLRVAGADGKTSATAQIGGVSLALVLSSTVPTFPTPILVGTSVTSPTLVTVENLGTTAITLQQASITGDFSLANSSCGATLGASSSCSTYVTFTPTTDGVRTGVFTVSDGAETHSIEVSGTGLFPATDKLGAAALSFPSTVVGQVSAAQSVTLTNSGDATLTQIATQVTGPFIATNNCGASLGGHLACTIAVSFAPNAVGPASGSLTVVDVQRTQVVLLSGQGAAPSQAFVSPSSLNFGPYALNIAAGQQTVTVSNQGAVAMTGVAATIAGGDFTIGSSTCGATLAPGASCQLGVVFTPAAIGNREGTLTIASSSLSEPLVVSLAGSGEDFQLSVVGTGTDVITTGQTASFQLAVTPVGSSAGSVAIACSGAPANSVCTANPASVSLSGGASGSITVTVATGVPASSAHADSSSRQWWVSATALALLCPFLLLRGEHRRKFLLVLAGVALLGSPIACGVHASGVNGSGAGAGPGQTPSGSYPITINATFPGAQRTVTVTLVVQ